jgi:hypothetical protein
MQRVATHTILGSLCGVPGISRINHIGTRLVLGPALAFIPEALNVHSLFATIWRT